MTRLAHLEDSCERAGLKVDTWSPGDGVTRYRFFLANDSQGSDYFGGRGIFTALGLKEAFAFVNGALAVRS
jgi:hypothetical protein